MKLNLTHYTLFAVFVLFLAYSNKQVLNKPVCAQPIIRVVLPQSPQPMAIHDNLAYRRRIYSGVPQHYTPIGYLQRESGNPLSSFGVICIHFSDVLALSLIHI